MSPLLAALIALAVGHSPAAAGAIIGAITAQQWVGIGVSAAENVPDIIKAFNALPVPPPNATGPQLLQDIQRAALTGVASAALRDWIAANEAAAIRLQDGIASQR